MAGAGRGARLLSRGAGWADETHGGPTWQGLDPELADLTLAVVAINAWNRVAIATRREPGSYVRAEAAPPADEPER